MNRKLLVLFFLSLIIGIAGCGNPVRHRVERSIAQSLPEIIGQAQSYSVKADGSISGMMNGKLRSLDIIGLGVQLKSGVTVSCLNVKITDISFDPDTKKIRSVGATEYSASLTDAELTRYLICKYPDIPSLSVNMNGSLINISAKPGVSVLRVPINANAGLIIKNEHILALDLKKLKVAGINAPGFAVDYLESKLDVIFDANDLGFDAKIKTVIIGPNTLTLDGNLDLIKAIEQQITVPTQ